MDIKTCECGHENPFGSKICQACGKPLVDGDSKTLIDMKYDGSAIRSKTYNKTIIDKVWNFFSSVKIGVWLIFLTLIASAVGSILPQEIYIPNTVAESDVDQFYKDEYGVIGQIFYILGFNNLYGSWWYILLLGLIGISVTIASLDRGIPLYKSLKNQKVVKHENFLKRQRLFGVSSINNDEELVDSLKISLHKRGYKVKTEDGNILAERGRFARWGAYVNHTGIIIFLLGAMLRFVPGMYVDETMWLREGDVEKIPGTSENYYLKLNKFTLDVYDKDDDQKYKDALNRVGKTVAKNYQSDVTLYKAEKTIPGAKPELKKVTDDSIKVNKPLKFHSYAVYQVDFKLNEFDKMKLQMTEKETGKSLGIVTIDLYNPKTKYDLEDGYSIKLVKYFPDFIFDANDEPATNSNIPKNPAFIFEMTSPDLEKPEVSFVGIRKNIEPFALGKNKYKMEFAGLETKNVTGLTIKKDHTIGIIFFGGIIFMIGVLQSLYWNHRRIWFKKKDGKLWIAAHVNKNYFSVKKDLEVICNELDLEMPVDQQELNKDA